MDRREPATDVLAAKLRQGRCPYLKSSREKDVFSSRLRDENKGYEMGGRICLHLPSEFTAERPAEIGIF